MSLNEYRVLNEQHSAEQKKYKTKKKKKYDEKNEWKAFLEKIKCLHRIWAVKCLSFLFSSSCNTKFSQINDCWMFCVHERSVYVRMSDAFAFGFRLISNRFELGLCCYSISASIYTLLLYKCAHTTTVSLYLGRCWCCFCCCYFTDSTFIVPLYTTFECAARRIRTLIRCACKRIETVCIYRKQT